MLTKSLVLRMVHVNICQMIYLKNMDPTIDRLKKTAKIQLLIIRRKIRGTVWSAYRSGMTEKGTARSI